MLDKMRKQAKIFIIVVAVAFLLTIVFSWGMDIVGLSSKSARNVYVGKINGQKISYLDYNNAIQQTYVEFKDQYKDREITDREMEQVKETAWNTMINRMLIHELIKKYNIKVSDNEIAQLIRFAPPKDVQQIPEFQTDGKFDYQKYMGFISSPQSDGFLNQLEYIFRTSFPEDKLYYRFFSTINVTDMELQNYYDLKTAKVKVNYIALGPEMVADSQIQVDSAAVAAYYNEHRDDFKKPEQLVLKVAKFSKSATTEDIKKASLLAQELYGRIKQGENFEKLAVDYSEDKATAEKGGDLGYFDREAMANEITDVAFTLDSGIVNIPIHTQHGWHIIRGEGKRVVAGKEEVRCRHILIREAAGHGTLDSLKELSEEFVQYARDHSFDKAMTKFAVQTEEMEPIARNNFFIPKLGYLEGLDFFLQTTKQGKISKLFESDKAMYIFYTEKILPEDVRPLAEVSSAIVNRLKVEKKVAFLEPRASELKARLAAIHSLSELDPTLRVDTTALFSRIEAVPGIGRGNEFIGLAFKLKKDECGGYVKLNNRYYFIQVVDQVVPTSEEFAANRETLLAEYTSQVRNIRYQQWFLALRNKMKVEDNRSDFF
ncbi:MAG: SurA N-terminal domain-containing protein [Candidatus Delongbacteria bacterium]|nr:SurA N-terminal domain-containing protein [Candidatus Delongbacteria bacterium]